MKIGNMPPKCQIIVIWTFHQVWEVEDLSWKLYIPRKIIPRYTGDSLGYVKEGAHLKGMVKKIIEENKRTERLDYLLEWVRGYYQSSNFNWSISITISSAFPIKRLISPSHNIKVYFLNDDNKEAFIELDENDENTIFNKDFVILFRTDQINKPTILMQKLGNEYALMVSMLADVTPDDKIEERNMQITDEVDLDSKIKYLTSIEDNMKPAEFYFILDRSGSMDGRRIEIAKEALILFLRSIPVKSTFNVISFGSDFESIFDGWVEYNQK